MASMYVISPLVKYRRENFGCILLNLKSKRVEFYNRSSAFLIESFIKPNPLSKNEFNDIPDSLDFLQNLIEEGVLITSTTKSPCKAALYNIDTLEFSHDHLYTPLGIEIELTRKCMRSCTYCAYDSHPNYDTTGELSFTEWKKVLRDASDLGVLFVRFTGGDPFTRPDAIDIIEEANQLGLLITIGTDLTVMNESIANSLSKIENLHVIQTSIDGPTKKIADKFRGNGNFRHVSKGLEILNKYHIPFMAGMVLTKENKNHLIETAEYAKILGAKHFVYTPIYKAGRAQDISTLELEPEELESASIEYLKWLKNNKDYVVSDLELEYAVKTPDSIRALDRYLRIDPLGNVYPSIKAYDALGGDCVLGTVKNSKIKSIWRDSKIINKLRRLERTQSLGGNTIPLKNIVEEVRSYV